MATRRPTTAHLACLLIAAVAATALAAPSMAAAGCGGTEVKQPKRNANRGGKPPLVIGDSVMLLSLGALSHAGYLADAKGCRSFEQGLGVVRNYKRKGRLGHLVVIALGANSSITRKDMRRALHVIGPRRTLGLVVPRETGGGTSSDARAVRAAYRAKPKRIVLLDWVRFAKHTPKWFQPDGLHLTYSGAAAYAKLMARAIPYARAGERPAHAHYPR